MKKLAIIFASLSGGRISASFFVARRSRTHRVRFASRVANPSKIRSAKLTLYVEQRTAPGIRSLIDLSAFRPLQIIQCSTPRATYTAIRKYISERTSYYRNRLAFHSLPRLIRRFCTINRFGPPSGFHRSSSWPRQALPASGLLCTAVRTSLKLGAQNAKCKYQNEKLWSSAPRNDIPQF